MSEVPAFLLSREWRDRSDGIELVLWARAADGPVCARFTGQEAVMFVARSVETRGGRRRERPLASLQGQPVDAVYFRSRRAMIDERERLRSTLGVAFESDVKPSDRFLMERFVTASMCLHGEGVVRRGVLRMENPRVTTGDWTSRPTDGTAPCSPRPSPRSTASASSCAGVGRTRGTSSSCPTSGS